VDQLNPDDRDATLAAWNKAVVAGKTFESEHRFRRADGAFRWFQTRAIPLRDEQGAIVKWFGTDTDIDELKRAQKALYDSEARFHNTFDTMLEVCQIVDRCGTTSKTTLNIRNSHRAGAERLVEYLNITLLSLTAFRGGVDERADSRPTVLERGYGPGVG